MASPTLVFLAVLHTAGPTPELILKAEPDVPACNADAARLDGSASCVKLACLTEAQQMQPGWVLACPPPPAPNSKAREAKPKVYE